MVGNGSGKRGKMEKTDRCNGAGRGVEGRGKGKGYGDMKKSVGRREREFQVLRK